MALQLGKLPPDLLQRLLAATPVTDRQVVVGPRPGVDAAVLDIGDRYLIATTDPITFTAERIGWYSAHVNANDIAVMGGTPRWMLATVLLPADYDEMRAVALHEGLVAACTALGVTLIGGHTEVTFGIDRPLVSATMLGEVAKERLLTSGGARPGDRLLITGGISIEGTAVLAAEARVQSLVNAEVITAAAALLERPGISVVAAAAALCRAVLPHAMHDATEGGLATALREVAEASGVGMRIERARIPVLPETAAIAGVCGLDPLGLLASGCLIAAVATEDAGAALAALHTAGITAAVIGEATAADGGLVLVEQDGSEAPLPRFARDELARFFEQ